MQELSENTIIIDENKCLNMKIFELLDEDRKRIAILLWVLPNISLKQIDGIIDSLRSNFQISIETEEDETFNY